MAQHLFHRSGVGGGFNRIAVADQEIGNHIPDAGIVVNHQDARAAAFAFHILFHSDPMSGPGHLAIASL
jgi:hypothetical protein